MPNKSFDSYLSDTKKYRLEVDQYISQYISELNISNRSGLLELKRSIEYSTQSGGKRFRPLLSMMVAEALGIDPALVLPFGVAVELVHTYSLIHDDLPSMDNSDLRRNQLTNHKKFGEATALLAGDALLTEAFHLISREYKAKPSVALELITQLSFAAGINGMVGGQSLDLNFEKEENNLPNLEYLHILKTGALIRVAAIGACIIAEASKEITDQIRKYAEYLGLAFQIADDILDFNREKPEKGSFTTLLGLDEARARLKDLSEAATECLNSQDGPHRGLRSAILYNSNRVT